MKIAVFTGNQPRHLALVNGLCRVADQVHAVLECSTVFPGQVADFVRKTPTMQRYFSRVIAAEHAVFGDAGFTSERARTLAVRHGDLNLLSRETLAGALDADLCLVFGASYIKGWLVEALMERGAINLHMGLSPYYRGSACNFWALHDGHPELVGATVHHLGRGLDSGAMLFHALPTPGAVEPFEFGMRAVRAGQTALLDAIATGRLWSLEPVAQDPAQEIRYSRNADFTDAVADAYLARGLDAEDVAAGIAAAPPPALLRPVHA